MRNAGRVGNRLPPTNEDTTGPYHPIQFYDNRLSDLTVIGPGLVVAPKGVPIEISGDVRDRYGAPAHGVTLEFWQANAAGIYRTPATEGDSGLDPWFDGFGRLRSDNGRYVFRTIMPGPAPGRAPCVTVTLFSDGIARIATQMFFAGHAANGDDPLLASLSEGDRDRLMARAEAPGRWRFDIHMAGPEETPFFEDLIG
ncbi:MAG: hypothetical protein AAGE83_00245 [Pseudomonadota bacterium]